MRAALERYFEFSAHSADWKTEVLAGVTTFMTMAYIVFVNPAILKEAGMPAAGVMAATCISAAVGSVLMGVLAKYPIALAPGMGINAYFAYSVVKGMGVPWQAALGGVFLSGVAFLLLTAVGVRQLIVSAIPLELHAAVAGGIGLFLALLGFENSGIVVAHPSTILALGNLHEPRTLLAIFCLLIIAAMMARRVKGAILIGMLVTTALSAALGLSHWQPQPGGGVWGTLLQLDIRAALTPRFLEVVLVLLFVTLFDNVGTLVGVARLAGMIDAENRIPRINRILVSDAVASMAGAAAGTSSVVSYIESSAGIAAGGRTGATAVVTGLLFAAAYFVAPMVGAIPAAATAPALIVVGSLMMVSVAEIRWDEAGASIPAFLTLLAIPFTFSIADGLAFGFTSYTLVKVFTGEFRKVNWLVYVLTALFVLRFAFYRG
jgi:adenine/guanine/hypoxanthine permease